MKIYNVLFSKLHKTLKQGARVLLGLTLSLASLSCFATDSTSVARITTTHPAYSNRIPMYPTQIICVGATSTACTCRGADMRNQAFEPSVSNESFAGYTNVAFKGSYTPTPSRFVIPYTGTYTITVDARICNGSDNNQGTSLSIYRNADWYTPTTVVGIGSNAATLAPASRRILTASATNIALNAGDIITVLLVSNQDQIVYEGGVIQITLQ